MAAQILQGAANEVAHIDQGVIGQIVKMLYGALRGRAGRGRDMVEASGASDIDPAMDGMDPRGAGIGDDDAGRAEDREPADDPQPRVHRLFGKPFAAGDRDRHGDIGRRRAVFRGHVEQRIADHRARGRIDRRLADGERKSGPGDRADPFASGEADARACRGPGGFGDDQRAMR